MKPKAKKGPLVRLISWHEAEVRQHAEAIEKAGWLVDASPFRHDRMISRIRDADPAVLLIDLDRKFSHGRVVAALLRSSKSTCQIPLVFVGGEAEKVERLRCESPHTFFTDWRGVAATLKKAIGAPVVRVKPKPFVEHFSGSSLVKKLGIKAGQKIALLGAPDGFEEQLDELPENVEFRTAMTRQTELVFWFVRSRDELEREIGFLAARLPAGVSAWIVYPKQASRFKVDFTQFDVRAAALAMGLVDYKICAVDADWTGMKFTWKRRNN